MIEPSSGSMPSPAGQCIVHLIPAGEWDRVQRRGEIRAEPFLHLCTSAQVAGVVTRYYRGVDDLLALVLDAGGLGSTLRWEPGIDPATGAPTPDGELFPHLYGPLPVDAVLAVHPAAALQAER